MINELQVEKWGIPPVLLCFIVTNNCCKVQISNLHFITTRGCGGLYRKSAILFPVCVEGMHPNEVCGSWRPFCSMPGPASHLQGLPSSQTHTTTQLITQHCKLYWSLHFKVILSVSLPLWVRWQLVSWVLHILYSWVQKRHLMLLTFMKMWIMI